MPLHFEPTASPFTLPYPRSFEWGLARHGIKMSFLYSIRRFRTGTVLFLGMALAPLGQAADDAISLTDAVRQAIGSILDLLDAQQQQLSADLFLANATYDFFEDQIASERQISFYADLESPAETLRGC
jgi:hypothetical protein